MKNKNIPLASTTTEIILESISDGVFTVDHQWRIMSFNKAAEKITGVPREEAIGKFCREVFRSNMCENSCALKKTMQKGKSFINSSGTIITRARGTIPIALSTSLLQDDSGKVLGGVEVFRDRSTIEQLRRQLSGSVQMGEMVSRSKIMKDIFSTLKQIAESDSTVLIEGETGTGKELLAKAIHSYSARKNKRFIGVNCGALPDTLLESELFGYKSGAFTGANHDKPGIFASARGGTILLDEIGDTSSAFQVKLLRLLEEKEFQPLGGLTVEKTDVRIVAATNRDLTSLVKEHIFRQDLFYRINIIHIKLPPLRNRKEDVPLLIDRFIEKKNGLKGRNITGMAPEALAVLMAHDFPGNIRELENIIEHCFVLCRGSTIEIDHLPTNLRGVVLPTSTQNLTDIQSTTLQTTVQLTEREIILKTLKENNYNRKATAGQLGMHKSTLFRKINKLAITLPDIDGRKVNYPKR